MTRYQPCSNRAAQSTPLDSRQFYIRSAPLVDSSARNVSPSRRMQLCIDASASMPFCKRVLMALYTLVSSKRSAPPSVSSARKRSPESFVFCRIRNREAARNLMKVYRLTAWMMVSTNFAFTEFSEGQLRPAERFSVRRVMSSSCSQPSPTKE